MTGTANRQGTAPGGAARGYAQAQFSGPARGRETTTPRPGTGELPRTRAGNPVAFSLDPSANPGVCSLSGSNGSTVTYTAVGNCVIDANQTGSPAISRRCRPKGQ